MVTFCRFSMILLVIMDQYSSKMQAFEVSEMLVLKYFEGYAVKKMERCLLYLERVSSKMTL